MNWCKSKENVVLKRPKGFKVDSSVKELEIDLGYPRVLVIYGYDRKGKRQEWHLKVTKNRKVALV